MDRDGRRVVRIRHDAIFGLMNPYAFTTGAETQDQLAKIAAELEELHEDILPAFMARKPKMSRAELIEAFEVETWMIAEEAIRIGFADEVVSAGRAAA